MRHHLLTEDFAEIASSKLDFEKFAGQTILITGASGMIGGYLTEFLLYLNEVKNLKIKVLALCRNREKGMRRFSGYKNNDFQLIIQDVTDPLGIKTKIDFIIHAASQASPKYFGADPVGTMLPNVVGSRNLLELSRLKKSELLFVSSSEVYGQLKSNQIPTKESDWGVCDPTNIRSSYAESKRLGETMGISYFHQYGVKVKIVRPFHIYGPGMNLLDGRIFADFTRDIVSGKNLVLSSSGTARRSFCYLADATCAFLTVIISGKAGEAYNVGNPEEEVSIKELAGKLIKLFPEKKLKVIIAGKKPTGGYLVSAISRSCPNISKIEKLGWHPKHSIENGFKRTILSFS